MITIGALRMVPPFAQGLVRDLRARWALEEAGLDYEAELFDHPNIKTEVYRREHQPFGQVPFYQEGELTLFESGAIVLHIAEKSEALMPRDPIGRAHVAQWIFAALNSIEPALLELASVDIFHRGEAWTAERRPQVIANIEQRLDVLAGALDGREYLTGRFTAADLMMATVLRILRDTDLVEQRPVLRDYLARCTARPAFQRALDAQMAPFRETEAA